MKIRIFYFIFLVTFFQCKSKETSDKIRIIDSSSSNFQMYKTSEMAELMRLMLDENKILRKKIIDGEEIGDFNEAFLKIHSAKMTDSNQRDETYPTFAEYFSNTYKDIFTVDTLFRKEQFNKSVNACISCHQNRCTGPIPTIKKLIIN